MPTPGRRTPSLRSSAFRFKSRSGREHVAELEVPAHRGVQRRQDGWVRAVVWSRPTDGLLHGASASVPRTLWRPPSQWAPGGSARSPGQRIRTARFLSRARRGGMRPLRRTRCSIRRRLTGRSTTVSPATTCHSSNFFCDLPMSAIIPSIILKHTRHLHQIASSFTIASRHASDVAFSWTRHKGAVLYRLATHDAALGDQGIQLELLGAGFKQSDPAPDRGGAAGHVWGELWAYGVFQAVLNSPQWPRTLLIYVCDEHGGYYDHVPPPRGSGPTTWPRGDGRGSPGSYDKYGRVCPRSSCRRT